MSHAAINTGYHVVELDLKGMINKKQAMNLFSWKLLMNVYDMDDVGCAHYYLLRCPAIEQTWNAYLDMAVKLLLSMGEFFT